MYFSWENWFSVQIFLQAFSHKGIVAFLAIFMHWLGTQCLTHSSIVFIAYKTWVETIIVKRTTIIKTLHIFVIVWAAIIKLRWAFECFKCIKFCLGLYSKQFCNKLIMLGSLRGLYSDIEVFLFTFRIFLFYKSIGFLLISLSIVFGRPYYS